MPAATLPTEIQESAAQQVHDPKRVKLHLRGAKNINKSLIYGSLLEIMYTTDDLNGFVTHLESKMIESDFCCAQGAETRAFNILRSLKHRDMFGQGFRHIRCRLCAACCHKSGPLIIKCDRLQTPEWLLGPLTAKQITTAK